MLVRDLEHRLSKLPVLMGKVRDARDPTSKEQANASV
jgi:hypothetical protein